MRKEFYNFAGMMTDVLKKEIVKAAGRAVKTPADYEWLSERIMKKTHERLSPTTLKRFFGYLHEPVKPRAVTLDVLARFVGYRDYETFCKEDEEIQSNIVSGEWLAAEDMKIGQIVRLTWKPDRVCVIRHLSHGLFEIIGRENTKLQTGDIFECHLFIRHEPLYISNIQRNGKIIIETYLIGNKSGICFEQV